MSTNAFKFISEHRCYVLCSEKCWFSADQCLERQLANNKISVEISSKVAFLLELGFKSDRNAFHDLSKIKDTATKKKVVQTIFDLCDAEMLDAQVTPFHVTISDNRNVRGRCDIELPDCWIDENNKVIFDYYPQSRRNRTFDNEGDALMYALTTQR